MRQMTRLVTAAVFGAGLSLLGCEANQSGTAGGYHSTSSEQNVGSRSSHGLYGGTVDQTGTAGGGTYGNYAPNTPATPYSDTTTPDNGTTPNSHIPPGGTAPDGSAPRYNGGVPTAAPTSPPPDVTPTTQP
jgi:hypothetical protein